MDDLGKLLSDYQTSMQSPSYVFQENTRENLITYMDSPDASHKDKVRILLAANKYRDDELLSESQASMLKTDKLEEALSAYFYAEELYMAGFAESSAELIMQLQKTRVDKLTSYHIAIIFEDYRFAAIMAEDICRPGQSLDSALAAYFTACFVDDREVIERAENLLMRPLMSEKHEERILRYSLTYRRATILRQNDFAKRAGEALCEELKTGGSLSEFRDAYIMASASKDAALRDSICAAAQETLSLISRFRFNSSCLQK